MPVDLTLHSDAHALYLPAINESFARYPLTPPSKLSRGMPGNLAPSDLNYLSSKSRLFHYHAGLHSAAFGAYENAPTIITQRDRENTIIVGDSGGFTEINGGLQEPLAAFRPKSLAWQERHCDVGIILDVPTRALDVKGSPYKTLQQCLDVTLDSMRFAIANRSNADMRLLAVMQGRTGREAKIWNAAVAPFQNDFEGIALAGATKLNFAAWAGILVEMRDQGLLDKLRWIHVLGTAQPGVGVMLTGLQRALRKHLHSEIRVSYDSSLAFRIVQVSRCPRHGEEWRAAPTLPRRGNILCRGSGSEL